MVTFEFRVTISPYKLTGGGERVPVLPYLRLSRTLTIPLPFIPPEMYLETGDMAPTLFKVERTYWDEASGKLFVVAEMQHWRRPPLGDKTIEDRLTEVGWQCDPDYAAI